MLEKVRRQPKREKKSKYSSLLKFVFTQFSDFFKNFLKEFKNLANLEISTIKQNLREFTNFLSQSLNENVHLVEKSVIEIENFKEELEKKKSKYFNVFNNSNFRSLNKIKNSNQPDIFKEYRNYKEKNRKYFVSFAKLNKMYCLLDSRSEKLIKQYEENIIQKFSLLYYKFNKYKPQSNKSDKKYIDCIEKFKLIYKECSTNIYIRNTNKIYEHFFTFEKLLSYKGKLEERYKYFFFIDKFQKNKRYFRKNRT